MAAFILRSTLSNDRTCTFTIDELRELLADAIAGKRLRREDLKPDLRLDVERFLNARHDRANREEG